MIFAIDSSSFLKTTNNKVPCASQNTEAKTLPAHVSFLVALDGFHLLLSTQLTANLTPEWSGGFMFHAFSHIYVKTPFCCIETVANNALNSRRVIVFDRLWANMHPLWTHWQMFMQNDEYTAFWYLQILAISCNFNLWLAKANLWSLFSVFRDNCRIRVTWAFSTICVCTVEFKVSLPTLNRCFRRSRVWITLIKPLLGLNSIFPITKQCFINTRNSDFSIVLKICNSFTWITVICIRLGLSFDTYHLKVSNL